MNAELHAELENARQSLLETYSLSLQYGTPDIQDTKIYLELGAQLSQIKEECKRHESALESAKEKRLVAEFESQYNAALKNNEKKKYDPKKTSEFKGFREQLLLMKQAHEDANAAASCATRVEEDDFVMESEINVFDPLTKQRMTNPVRNQLCGHHYEKSTILEAIQINNGLRCPVAGCGNKNYVSQKNLQEDHLFKIRLQQLAERDSED